jgi:hypothetical protein
MARYAIAKCEVRSGDLLMQSILQQHGAICRLHEKGGLLQVRVRLLQCEREKKLQFLDKNWRSEFKVCFHTLLQPAIELTVVFHS